MSALWDSCPSVLFIIARFSRVAHKHVVPQRAHGTPKQQRVRARLPVLDKQVAPRPQR